MEEKSTCRIVHDTVYGMTNTRKNMWSPKSTVIHKTAIFFTFRGHSWPQSCTQQTHECMCCRVNTTFFRNTTCCRQNVCVDWHSVNICFWKVSLNYNKSKVLLKSEGLFYLFVCHGRVCPHWPIHPSPDLLCHFLRHHLLHLICVLSRDYTCL
jgi:hypothetical protein